MNSVKPAIGAEIDYSEYNLSKEECFTLRYDEDSCFLACGYSTGKISIYNLTVPEKSENYVAKNAYSEFPITCLRWKPHNKTTLISVSADGNINQIHSKTGKVLQQILEEDNPLMCVDYSYDGSFFATGGKDKVARLYDDNTKTLITKLESHKTAQPQHSNRIFSLKFSEKDQNLLLSGGWDNTILLYDLRAKEVQNYLYGPHICGDGMDLKDDLLLTVSWSDQDQIQFFDLRTMKKIGVFLGGPKGDKKGSHLYSCKFHPKEKTFCVTGSNKNYFGTYDYSNLLLKQIKNTYELVELNTPCYCCDYNKTGEKIAYGCSDNKVHFH